MLNRIAYNYLSPREDLIHKFVIFKKSRQTIKETSWTNHRREKFKLKCKFRYLKCRLSNRMQISSLLSSLSFCEEKLSGPVHNRMLCLSYYVKTAAARRNPGKTTPSHIPKFHVQCICNLLNKKAQRTSSSESL